MKRKGKTSALKKIWREAPSDDLIEFLQKQVDQSSELANQLLFEFAHLWEEHAGERFRNLVAQALGRQRQLIDRPRGQQISRRLQPLLQQNRTLMAEANWRDALTLTEQLMDQVFTLSPSVQDFPSAVKKDLTTVISDLDLLLTNCEAPLIKDEVQERLAAMLELPAATHWQVDKPIFKLLIKHHWSPAILTRIRLFYQEKLKQNPNDPARETWVLRQIAIARVTDDQDTFAALLTEYQHLFEVRLIAIEQKLETSAMDAAMQLCQDGLAKLVHPHDFGKIRQLESLLLQIAESNNDVPLQRNLLRKKYLSSKEHDAEIFQKIKGLHTEPTWSGVRQALRREIGVGTQAQRLKVAALLVEEEQWPELLELCEQHIHLVKFAEPYLVADYPQRLLEIHRRSLERYLATHTGRKFYRRLCGELRRIHSHIPGGEIFVTGMIVRFRSEATSKPAFVEELNRLDVELRG